MRRRAFSIVVAIALGSIALFGLIVLQPGLVTGLLGQQMAGHVLEHFREPHHRIHDVAFASLLGIAALGLLARLALPSRSVSGTTTALVPFLALALIAALTTATVLQVPWVVAGAVTLLAAALDPGLSGFLRSLGFSRADRVMLALLAVAAVPLLAAASSNIALQRSDPSQHAALGHYGFLAAFDLTVIVLGLLAALRPSGWRLPAWIAGGLPALLGLVSFVSPDADSRLDVAWAALAITWGLAFIAAAELRRATAAESTDSTAGISQEVRTASPASVAAIVAAVAVIVVVLLFAAMHLTGGAGPSLHGPPGGH